jgi:hypothetical protein
MGRCENWEGCYNKATWVVKGTISHIGIKKKVTKRVCDKCCKIINPELKRRITGQADEIDKLTVMFAQDAPREYVDSDILMFFRKIR